MTFLCTNLEGAILGPRGFGYMCARARHECEAGRAIMHAAPPQLDRATSAIA